MLQAVFAGERNATAGTKNALPGQAGHLVQDFRDVAGASRVAGGLGNRTIGAHFSARDSANDCGDGEGER